MWPFSAVIAVLGGGNGGRALAGDLARLGAPVALWNRTADHVEGIALRGGIELEGVVRGFGPLKAVSDDLGEVLSGSELVMVCVPAFAHREVAERCAPHLIDGQVIVLHPGRTFGALEFRQALRAGGCTADVVVAEAATFIFASRSSGPAQSRVMRVKHAVPVAALPASRTEEVVVALHEWYSQFSAAANVLETSFANVGAVIHPTISILNAARIENTQGRFDFYVDGVSPSVAKVLESVDRERMAIAQLLGVQVRSLREWLASAYRATGNDLYEAIQANEGYRGIAAPPNLENRYLLEDVPMSLVPIASAGRVFGLRARAIESVIDMAGFLRETRFWSRGRTLERLGLDQLSPTELRRFVEEGE